MPTRDTYDDTRFGHVYAELHPRLVRFLTRLTGCAQRAEDLAQTAWLKVLAAPATPWGSGSESELRAYLYTAARNLFVDEYTRKHAATRTRTVAPHQIDALAGSGAASVPEDEVQREQTRASLATALAALPDEQRRVILMWVSGASIRDMAEHAAAPVDTVLSRKKYALARMRGALAPVAHALG
jgi:RNA polymerase sigma-70 factor (ECF subfamily)